MASPPLLPFNAPVIPGRFTIRTVQARHDPYAGLKGHDYIKARNLNPPVVRVQTSAQTADKQTTEGKQ